MYIPTLIFLFTSLALVRNLQGDEEDVRLRRDRAAQRKVLAHILCQGLRQIYRSVRWIHHSGCLGNSTSTQSPELVPINECYRDIRCLKVHRTHDHPCLHISPTGSCNERTPLHPSRPATPRM